jgi:hypothetical protein
MAGAPFSAKNLRVNALAIIPDPQPKLPVAVADFDLDVSRVCVPKCIAQSLAGNPVDFVAKVRMETPWHALHPHPENCGRRIGSDCCKFLSDRLDGFGDILRLYRGRAQSLYRIPAFGDRRRSLIDRAPEIFFGFGGARWQQIINRLKTEQ